MIANRGVDCISGACTASWSETKQGGMALIPTTLGGHCRIERYKVARETRAKERCQSLAIDLKFCCLDGPEVLIEARQANEAGIDLIEAITTHHMTRRDCQNSILPSIVHYIKLLP